MKTAKFFSYIILLLIVLVLLTLTALLFIIPTISNSGTLALKYTDGSNAALRIFLYIADFAAIWFMLSLFIIMCSVSAGDPFVMKNVRLLQFLALACLIAFASFASMIVLYANYDCFGLIICTMILLFGTLCAFVLSQVFSRAVAYKSENDLTV